MQDFAARLREQIEFLDRSSREFDAGHVNEAIRIATTTRTLVHDTRRSTSLLTHLGVKGKLGFVDRGPVFPSDPRVIYMGFGLCRLHAEVGNFPGQVRLVPEFDSGPPENEHPPVSFLDWWERPILRDQSGREFSRKDFVLMLANKDGGAHVDATLPEDYAALTRGNSVQLGIGPENRPAGPEIVSTSVRHIAFELQKSILVGIDWKEGAAQVPNPICPLALGNDLVKSLGRNDACPCGSGLKLKRCFGQRLPLNRWGINPEIAKAA